LPCTVCRSSSLRGVIRRFNSSMCSFSDTLIIRVCTA
jgi:hypothetical protein